MSYGMIVRRRREEMKLTQDQVASRVGISKPYLSNVETGVVKNPPSDAVSDRLEKVLDFQNGELRKLAHLTRTPPDVRRDFEAMVTEVDKLRATLIALAEKVKLPKGAGLESMLKKVKAGANISPISSAGKPIPVINRVIAGYPHDFTDLDYPPSVADEYVRCPDVHDPQAFAARVVGDSMEPNYVQNDLVIFAPNQPARSGDDVFVRLEKDAATTFKRYVQTKGGKIRLEALNEKYAAQEYDPKEITGLWPAVMKVQRLK